MMGVIGRGEDFGFIDVVYANGFEDLYVFYQVWMRMYGGRWTYLAFNKMPNSCLGHDRDGDGLHDLFNHLWV
jgi:hypothetical protein